MRFPDYLFSPLTWILLWTLVLVLAWRRLPRAARYAGVVLEVVLLLLIAPVGANALVRMVESRVPPPQTCPAPTPTTIVLLDGGTDRRPRSADDYAALDISSLRRLFAAVALWQHTPHARLVISGGGWGVPHSVLLRGLAEHLGVPADAIEIEESSKTTWENARDTSRLSSPVPKRIWLASSALHLPRALDAFRAWGFEPCAWPTDSLYTPFSLRAGYFMPQSSSLAKADLVMHELVGGLVYRGLEWKKKRQGTGSSVGSR